MKIIEVEIKKRTPNIINQLLTVWESSVRATHLFLSDSEIKHIKEYVPQALMGIAHLMIAKNDMGCPVAFMGIEDGTLEIKLSYMDEFAALTKTCEKIRKEVA